MSAAKTKAEKIIEANSVVVFSKSWCSYSRASKKLLTDMGAKFYAIDLDLVDDGSAMQDALEQLSNGQYTVPNIWIKQKHIGGNSDLQAKKGKVLKGLLADAGAL